MNCLADGKIAYYLTVEVEKGYCFQDFTVMDVWKDLKEYTQQ